MPPVELLPQKSLTRYADAIVKASLAVGKGDTLVVQGEPEHRELLVAVAESAYRAGARYVEALVSDPLVMRARLRYGSDEALGAVSPWTMRRLRELAGPRGAMAAITGQGDGGYLDGIAPARISTDYARFAKATTFLRKAQLGMESRWTIAAWPTEYWARQVYPELTVDKGKRRLAQDVLNFCRLTDEDGKGSSGWLRHVRKVTRRGERLTRLGLARLELRSPGTELDLGLVPGTIWLGGLEKTMDGRELAANMPTEEVFTSPDARATPARRDRPRGCFVPHRPIRSRLLQHAARRERRHPHRFRPGIRQHADAETHARPQSFRRPSRRHDREPGSRGHGFRREGPPRAADPRRRVADLSARTALRRHRAPPSRCRTTTTRSCTSRSH
jgi:thermophilic metalloprotease (M29)